jgi:U6 snRNA phosphodiesterase
MPLDLSLGLSGYGSSGDDSDAEIKPPPAKKRRKLPELSSSLVAPVPVDNPALHQGRVRLTPFVEGQWAAYVYVPVVLSPRSPLRQLLVDVVSDAKGMTPALQSFIGDGQKDTELHISLSRPLYIRAHQREDLKRAVRGIARSKSM